MSFFFLPEQDYIPFVFEEYFAKQKSPRRIELFIADYGLPFFSYIIFSSIIACGFGYFVGRLVVSGPLRMLARHKWVYDVIEAQGNAVRFPRAYVLTNVAREDRVLLYSGFCEEIYLNPAGTVAYMALSACRRHYLHLHNWQSEISDSKDTSEIDGETHDRHFYGSKPFLIIEGEDIANIVFNISGRVDIRGANAILDRALALKNAELTEQGATS